MEERNVIDVTCFLLFESSGDSEEANSDLGSASNSLEQDTCMSELEDAQSCSDLVGPNELCVFDHDEEHHVVVVDDDDDKNDHVVFHDEEEKDKDGIDEEWSTCGKLVLQKKSKVCVDYSKMNERDKDKHFWETCLAS